jgi:hypothetical protein
MGFLDWFSSNISKPFLDAGKWLGQKVVSPALNWLKGVPVIGNIVKAAQPAIDLVGKTWNAASVGADESRSKQNGTFNPNKKQKMDLPTLDDVGKAVGSIKDVAGQVSSLGSGTKFM